MAKNMVSNYQIFQNCLHLTSTTFQKNKLSTIVKFAKKHNLPKLPVPKLNQTITKYLKSVEPYLNEFELANTRDIVRKFEYNEGAYLQSYLEQKAQNCECWLTEWLHNAVYLEVRKPIIFSSPALVYPLQHFTNEMEQVDYAAKMILGAIDYKFLIDKALIPIDKIGEDLLDMNQYKKLYGTCRIPRPTRDKLEFNPDSKHIVVARNNNFFKMEIITSDNRVPSFNQILSQLMFIIKNSEIPGAPVGILTSENRDNWSSAYAFLTADKTNQKTVDTIEKSLFILCLDNAIPEKDDDILSKTAKHCIHGGGLNGNSGNRWFDKTIQLIVSIDGTVGLTYDHSPIDGQVPTFLMDHVFRYIEGNTWKALPDVQTEKYPEPLPFNIGNELSKALTNATVHIDKLVDTLEVAVFEFGAFGKDFVKSQNLSPDSFFQTAIQYAFYRVHKIPGGQYEAVTTRKYIHGRTETVRSCSSEAIIFAKAMLDTDSSDAKRIAALKKAVSAHKSYTLDAMNGAGIDKHLLGLKMAAIELGQKLPELYTDIAYLRSSQDRITTSQVTTEYGGLTVFAPLLRHSYSCSYSPGPEHVFLTVTCLADDLGTDFTKFKSALVNSLLDMHNLLVRYQEKKL